jgi:flagellar basal body-associated protein FliL
MGEIPIWIVLVFAVAIVGVVFGMFALEAAKRMAEESKTPVPRLPGLTPEQTFCIGGVVLTAGSLLLLLWG